MAAVTLVVSLVVMVMLMMVYVQVAAGIQSGIIQDTITHTHYGEFAAVMHKQLARWPLPVQSRVKELR